MQALPSMLVLALCIVWRVTQLLDCLQDIGNRYQGNILVVAHGEVTVFSAFPSFKQTTQSAVHVLLDIQYCLVQAVNRSIVRLMPWTTVVEAKHCCYSVASRQQDGDGDWGPWELDVNHLSKVQVLGF